jgi:Ser/Thr protein kinase RdoA (MazF antagonist)
MLEAQNAAMAHVADRVTFCPRVLPTIAGETIGVTPDHGHLVRLVTFLAGVPLAEVGGPGRAALGANQVHSGALMENFGRAVGRLDAALADFDHPAAHRDFHWDLAQAARVIGEHLPRVRDAGDRALVGQTSAAAWSIVEPRRAAFRRSVIHNDANDWNVLVDGDRIAGIIDFGDMVHSWTVADLAVAAAYAVLDDPDPLATATSIARGYHAEYPLRDEESSALMALVSLRLCMSACIAAWQQEQRPDDEYLAISQDPIRRTLPRLAAISHDAAATALRSAT